MNVVFIATLLFYMLSSAGYLSYLFLQKDFLQKAASLLLLSGFVCHTLVIAEAAVRTGTVPVNNMHETLSITAWTTAGVFILLQFKYRLKILGIYAAPLVTLVMVVSSWMPKAPFQNQGLLKSFWLAAHIIMVFIGDAAFALACGIGILYLVQEHTIKNKKRGFFFSRLPSLDLLDTTGYACVVTGFSFLTIGLVIGVIYAKSVWGHFWTWDPKEVWSAITWVFYAAMLHIRIAWGWGGRRSAVMAIIGFIVLLFTFFGVNFLLKGHHGQFTSK